MASQAEIATYAYKLWEEQGCVHGQDVEHWLEAERYLSRAEPKFDVVLTDAGENKIRLVREIRAATGLELTKVQELVEEVPQPIQRAIPEETAHELMSALEAVGGSLEIRPTN